jgi:hypothetical protein
MALLFAAGCRSVAVEPEAPTADLGPPGPASAGLVAHMGVPVRGLLESGEKRTVVEVCVREVALAGKKGPAFVRFTMRLCTEQGETSAEECRPSKRPGWNYDAVPEGWSGDAVSGVPFRRMYGSAADGSSAAWEIDATADVLDAERVRFTVSGQFWTCIK